MATHHLGTGTRNANARAPLQHDGSPRSGAMRERTSAGQLLRHWRQFRRFSQLELALRADVSARHLSFVETNRAAPSREMILHLADQLDVPLREQNQMLLAAGFAPVYSDLSLDSPELTAVRSALSQLLAAHEPFPAAVVDRHWNLVQANPSIALFTACIDPALLAPPANVYRASLHPRGMAPRIINLSEWRAHVLGRLRRQFEATGDPALGDLYDEMLGYADGSGQPASAPDDADSVVVPLRFRHDDRELRFFSTVATFGTPLDVTVAEIVIESFFPADDATRAFLQAQSNTGSPDSGA